MFIFEYIIGLNTNGFISLFIIIKFKCQLQFKSKLTRLTTHSMGDGLERNIKTL